MYPCFKITSQINFIFIKCIYMNIFIKKGNIQIVREMINNNYDINKPDEQGMYPIHIACMGSNIELVMHLISKHAELECISKEGRRPIHYASKNINGYNIVLLLIKYGVNIECPEEKYHKGYPIHNACKNKNGHEIVNLFIKKGVNLECIDIHKKKPIHYACIKSVKSTELLIKHGVDLECCDAQNLRPIHCVCKNHNNVDTYLYILKLLINNKVNLECKTHYGFTPIYFAYKYNIEAFKLLLNNGANINNEFQHKNKNINIKSQRMETLLTQACRENNYDAIILLCEYKYNKYKK